MYYGKQEYSSRDNSYFVVCIMTYFSNTEYKYTSILAACPIFTGWGFIQWNCYAELSSQSERSYSIENVCISWNLSFRTESHSVRTSMVGCISKFYFLYVFCPLLHKTRYVLLPSVQKHVQSHLTLALTLFFWFWTNFAHRCDKIGLLQTVSVCCYYFAHFATTNIFAKFYPKKLKYLLLISDSIFTETAVM